MRRYSHAATRGRLHLAARKTVPLDDSPKVAHAFVTENGHSCTIVAARTTSVRGAFLRQEEFGGKASACSRFTPTSLFIIGRSRDERLRYPGPAVSRFRWDLPIRSDMSVASESICAPIIIIKSAACSARTGSPPTLISHLILVSMMIRHHAGGYRRASSKLRLQSLPSQPRPIIGSTCQPTAPAKTALAWSSSPQTATTGRVMPRLPVGRRRPELVECSRNLACPPYPTSKHDQRVRPRR